MRKEAAKARYAAYLKGWTEKALYAEAFLLALWPVGATIALLAGVVLLLVRFRLEKDFNFRHLPLDVPACLFALLGAASIIMSPDKGFSFYNYYNLVGVYLLTYFLAGQVLREKRQVRILLATIGAAACLVMLYGFYQFLFGIDTADMKWVDGEAFPELKKRIFSTWENPNILAGYLDIMACLAMGQLVTCGNKERRIVIGVFLLAAVACLAMTYARGACLVLAIVLAGYGALKDYRVLLACLGVAGALLLLDPVLYERMLSVFTKVDTSTEMRLAFWESTWAMIQDHPFLGIGWGAFYLVYPEYDFYMQGAPILIVHAHNMYLNYAAEIGIPGMLAFMWFFFGSLYLAFRARFSMPGLHLVVTPFTLKEEGADKELADITATIEASMPQPARAFWHEIFDVEEWRLLSGLSLGLGLAFISIALNGLTDHLLFNIPSSMFFWLLAALTAAVYLMQDDREIEGENSKLPLLEAMKSKLGATLEEVRKIRPDERMGEILSAKPEEMTEEKAEPESEGASPLGEEQKPKDEEAANREDVPAEKEQASEEGRKAGSEEETAGDREPLEAEEAEKDDEDEEDEELEEKLKLFEKMKKPEDRKEGEADREEGKD